MKRYYNRNGTKFHINGDYWTQDGKFNTKAEIGNKIFKSITER